MHRLNAVQPSVKKRLSSIAVYSTVQDNDGGCVYKVSLAYRPGWS